MDSGSSSPAEKSLTELTLRGRVEKVIYAADGEDGFQVLSIQDMEGKSFCACGILGGVCEGQGVELKGHWENHARHGRRFRVTECIFSLPATVEGIKLYLASGVIKGIGEKYAEAITKTFGAETLQVLENASSRLKEVPGLGKKRIEAIRKAWSESSGKRDLQLHMQSLGITPAYFNRIYSIYGNDSAAVLRQNPYQLASEVDGIGFIMADRIAGKNGIGKTDPQRLIAGVKYTLEHIRTAGHVCMAYMPFLQEISRLLEIGEDFAQKALVLASEAGKAVIVKAPDGERMVYESALLRCEQELPFLLAQLMKTARYAGQKILQIPSDGKTVFSDEQLRAVEQAGKTPVSIITGGPGVGKTTVVSEIVRRAKLAGLDVVLAAPTGRAAKRMSETSGMTALTLHRLLKWDPAAKQFVHNRRKPLHHELFILDEVSMLDLMLSVAFFRAVRPGASVVLVGDADQLPSVGPGSVLNDLIACGEIPVSRLTKIFRQGSGSTIIRAAHDVNQGIIPRIPAGDRNTPADFYWIEKEDPAEVSSLIEQMVLQRIPARFGLDPARDIQIITPMNRGSCGTVELNTLLQNRINPEKNGFRSGEKVFHVGDKVMQISNDYDKGVFNGDMGFITAVRHGDSTFMVQFDQGVIPYAFSDARELNLAYAVTVHKSQGSEFPAVIMPLLNGHYMMLQRNLLYTGMTRAKKLMILIGSAKAVSMAVRNTVKSPRFSLLLPRLQEIFSKSSFRGKEF